MVNPHQPAQSRHGLVLANNVMVPTFAPSVTQVVSKTTTPTRSLNAYAPIFKPTSSATPNTHKMTNTEKTLHAEAAVFVPKAQGILDSPWRG
ncbi:hypothetical protein VPNG_07632 [Cytospora leucostoma]|uniref:Uncharacterized protein n=1 Tax=Cytospora leucostoma TaxID=1230097 RepID=A0A423WFM7_9PEZI|nr:hypothetical protein VPNG_07632 [Cytospora leucostoma]